MPEFHAPKIHDLGGFTVARALPYCWAEQERRVGPSAPFHG